MNSKPLIFLDTSVQIERLLGSLSQRQAIEQHLAIADCTFVTSTYVFMEFQRAVLADYANVYNTLYAHPVWEETAQVLRSGKMAYRPRALGRCMQILTQAMTLSKMDCEVALSLLKATIRYDLPGRFWQHVTRLPDPITCDLVVKGVKFQGDNQCIVGESCRKEDAACHLPDFLSQHQAVLQNIIAYLKTQPHAIKQQERVARLLQNVIADPHAALGQSACWPLGDIIIALQALPHASIWTSDSDFQPIAQAIGLPLYTLTSDK